MRSEKSHFFDVSEGVFARVSVGRLTRNKLSRILLGRKALIDMVHPRRHNKEETLYMGA
jgi:hypothetical protein